ncbi:MAG: efflux RND transporter periplasmic adaptor subunit [Phycisphaerae bacterium]
MTSISATGLLAALASVTAVLASAVRGQEVASENDQSHRTVSGERLTVEVTKASVRPLTRELRLPATLRADEQVDLFAKVSGYVAEIKVDIGSRVKKGDLLARLSVPEMADELRRAEALLNAKQARVHALRAKAEQALRKVETARAEVQRQAAQRELDALNLKRKQELHEGDAIPEQALDEARSALAISEAQLQIARAKVAGAEAEKQAIDADGEAAAAEVAVTEAELKRLTTLMAYAALKAPFDGVITVRNVDHGTFVRSAANGAATPLLRIAKTDRIRIVLEIPESDAPYTRVGTEVEINVKALSTQLLSGVVSRTAGAVKPETRTMRAEVDLGNTDGRFTPGMYARVSVKLESKARALLIPSKALRVQGKDTVVLVVADGVAKFKRVEVGYDDGIWAEILSGLEGGEMIITSTSGALVPGTKIMPVLSGS